MIPSSFSGNRSGCRTRRSRVATLLLCNYKYALGHLEFRLIELHSTPYGTMWNIGTLGLRKHR